MAKYIPYDLPSHAQKIARLYKAWLRDIEANEFHRHNFRYRATLARAEFDQIFHEKDMIKAKKMLEDKEEELYRIRHPDPLIFPTSPGGVAEDRSPRPHDWLIDYWHPLEKAHYPEYFARREVRKYQYIQMWEKRYGPADPNDNEGR